MTIQGPQSSQALHYLAPDSHPLRQRLQISKLQSDVNLIDFVWPAWCFFKKQTWSLTFRNWDVSHRYLVFSFP